MAAILSSALRFLLLRPLLGLSRAATFQIVNHCSHTVWAAAVQGGGIQLNTGQNWTINVNPSTTGGRVWAHTGCSFDASGRGKCQTGDCGGLLKCTGYGSPPNTLAELSLNQPNNLDNLDISNVGLKPNGIFVVKENTAKSGFVLDKEDNSVTRSDLYFKELFKQCGLHLHSTKDQRGFPKELFSVKMYALTTDKPKYGNSGSGKTRQHKPGIIR